jgi:hypothetical protein
MYKNSTKKIKPKTKNKTIKKKVKQIYRKKYLSDTEIAKKEGEMFNSNHQYLIIDSNTDVYKDSKMKIPLLKYRRNVISNQLTKLAIESFRGATKGQNDNRGAAAGKIDLTKILERRPYLKGRFTKTSRFRTYMFREDGTASRSHIANPANSGIVGWFDKGTRKNAGNYPPCRLTAFTKKNLQEYQHSFPFIKKVDQLFKKYLPKQWKNQKKQAFKTKAHIADTCFSTITVNRDFRTALHRDSGDYQQGFGVMSVCTTGDLKGGYFLFPQYKIAVKVRNGDILLADVHEWHCNSPIKGKGERFSFVFYLRENMEKACSKNPPAFLQR